MTLHIRWRWALGFVCLLLGWACSARANNSQEVGSNDFCPQMPIGIVSANRLDFQDACVGAQAALEFFNTLGFQTAYPLVITIVEKMPEEAGADALGCYLSQKRQVFLLTYAEFEQRRSWFKVSTTRELYRSLVTHEAAHAMAACISGMPSLSLQAQEYVAYVVMFATMQPELRMQILRALPGTGFDSEIQISAVFYLLDPFSFGAESYRHFIKQGSGAAFLRLVLTRKALND